MRYFIDNAESFEGANTLLWDVIERVSNTVDADFDESLAVLDYLIEKPELKTQMASAYMACAAMHQLAAAEKLLRAGLEDEEVQTGPDSFESISTQLEERGHAEFAALIRGEGVDLDALRATEERERKQGAELAAALQGVTAGVRRAGLDGEEREVSYRNRVEEIRAGSWEKALDSRDPHGSRSAIEFIAANGLTEMAEALLEVSSLNANDGYDAAIAAAVHGHHDMIRLLEANGVEIAKTSKKKNSPLSEACRHGHLVIVQHLLDAGADPDAGDASGHGFTLDDLAGGVNRSRIIDALRQARGK